MLGEPVDHSKKATRFLLTDKSSPREMADTAGIRKLARTIGVSSPALNNYKARKKEKYESHSEICKEPSVNLQGGYNPNNTEHQQLRSRTDRT